MANVTVTNEQAVAIEMGFCRTAIIKGRKEGATATETALAKAASAFLEACGQAFYGDEGEDAARRDPKQASETIEAEARAVTAGYDFTMRVQPASVWLWESLVAMAKYGWPDVTDALRARIKAIVADDQIRLAVCAA